MSLLDCYYTPRENLRPERTELLETFNRRTVPETRRHLGPVPSLPSTHICYSGLLTWDGKTSRVTPEPSTYLHNSVSPPFTGVLRIHTPERRTPYSRLRGREKDDPRRFGRQGKQKTSTVTYLTPSRGRRRLPWRFECRNNDTRPNSYSEGSPCALGNVPGPLQDETQTEGGSETLSYGQETNYCLETKRRLVWANLSISH